MKDDRKRNITFSLPADLIQQAKVLAANRESSVNAIVVELLRRELEKGREETLTVVERILDRASKVKIKMPPKNERWTRDSLYDD